MAAPKARRRAQRHQLALSSSVYVVLGMLRLGARSGYDIKRLVDLSGRHFWTIGYPQIYPELDRLEDLGLIKGKTDPGSPRKRRLYTLTGSGEEELERWLADEGGSSLEIRDVGLLKVFFSATPAQAREQLATIRRRSEAAILVLEAKSRPATGALDVEGNPFPLLTVEFGVELHRAIMRTCRKLERRLDES